MREQIVTEPIWRLSHPSRVRGLKLLIRTYPLSVSYFRRTLHGCVDWNFAAHRSRYQSVSSHPSRVRGLKWHRWTSFPAVRRCRTLHGCVDWNFSIFGKTQRKIYMSHPSRVRGLNAYPVCHRNGLFIVVSPEDSFLLGRGWMAMDFAGSMPAKSTLCLFHLSLFTSSTV